MNNMATPMGSLKPNATYIYERVGGSIFAREHGSTERRLIGHCVDYDAEMQTYRDQISSVLRMCETDRAMRELLDQLFVLYNLKKLP
jgi:hypothetical protein